MLLKIHKSILERFLNSLSKISDQGIVKIDKSNITSIVNSADNTCILYAEYKGDFDVQKSLNIPDLKRLSRILESVGSNEIELKINSNNLSYNSTDFKFKYHLYDDSFLTPPSIKVDKIKSFETDFTFTLDKADFNKIIKTSTFSTESNKLYFHLENGEVLCELTDKATQNVDSYSLKVGKIVSGTELKSIPLNFENFKLINNFTDTVTVHINNKFGIAMFDIVENDLYVRYIFSSFTQ